ncbi:hypothetical protein ABLE68_21710 [Nocardioides sp. CN2-186]|uniref:hypothetical protein n=1 Tax=Nocardioides tweenelious TaxID=3156607 RepID=UPI0032B5E180
MQPQNDDEAWRAIIENYGDRPEIEEPPVAPESDTPTATPDAPFGGRFGVLPGPIAPEDEDDPFVADEEEGYDPPPPPPVPRTTPDRLLAWIGIFGSPAVLLASLILQISLPSLIGYLLILGFVGGFVYLVAKMPREPRDPWDDGAQI